MQALKFSLFTLLLSGILLTSCKKEADEAVRKEAAAHLYERTLNVYTADKTNAVRLRFRSASSNLLAGIALDRFDFVLVPAPVLLSANAARESIPDNSLPIGKVVFSGQQATREVSPADVLHGTDKRKIVFIDIQSAPNMPYVSIEVKSKAVKEGGPRGAKASEETLFPADALWFFHAGKSWHRVQITNLTGNLLTVYFYYDSCDGYTCQTHNDLKGTFTQYSGHYYQLFYNGYAYYYNCYRAVGALIYVAPNTAYNYQWTWWSNCYI